MVKYDYCNVNYNIYNKIKHNITNSANDFEKCCVVMDVVNKSFAYDGSRANLYKSREIFNFSYNKGLEFGINCFHLATILCEILLSYKIKTRFIHIFPKNVGESHCLVEVFLNKKWIALDPTFNAYYTYNNEYLSVMEIFEIIHDNKEVVISRSELNNKEVIEFYKRQSDMIISYENNTFESILQDNQKFIVLLNKIGNPANYFLLKEKQLEEYVKTHIEFKKTYDEFIKVNSKRTKIENYTKIDLL